VYPHLQAHLLLRPELRAHQARQHHPRALVVVAAVVVVAVVVAARLCRPLGLRVAEAFWWHGTP